MVLVYGAVWDPGLAGSDEDRLVVADFESVVSYRDSSCESLPPVAHPYIANPSLQRDFPV